MDKQPFTDQDLKGWAKFFVIVGAGLLLLYFIVPEDDRACILFFRVCFQDEASTLTHLRLV